MKRLLYILLLIPCVAFGQFTKTQLHTGIVNNIKLQSPSQLRLANMLDSMNRSYQLALISGTNIKTINGSSVLGSGNLTVSATGGSSYTFTSSSPSYADGKLIYDNTCQCLTFYNNDSNVSLQIGQETWSRVINVSGSTIPNGSVVYVNGTSGGYGSIALAQANAGTTAVPIGLTTEDITNNATGFVTRIGLVNGLNTSSFSAGAVYLSSTVAGGLTQTAPSAPNFRYRVGFVTNVNASTGIIDVSPSTAETGTGTANQIYGVNAAGTLREYKTLSGASNRLSLTNGAGTLGFDIDANYAGQATITTLGTIGTGTWQGGLVAGQYGGTGVNNSGKTITLGGNLTTSGAFATTITTTATTGVTLPTSGTIYGTATGSITSLQLSTSLSDETGTGVNVMAVSPALTGTPTAPTAAAATNTTQIATTAHVFAERSNTLTETNHTIGDKIRGTVAANTGFGTAVLVAGTVTVSNTGVSASSIILLTSNVDGGTVGFVRVSARVNATSFTITSSSGSDTSTIGYIIIN